MASKAAKKLPRALSAKLIKIKGSGPRDPQVRSLHEKPCRLMASTTKKELASTISAKFIKIKGAGPRDHQLRNLHEKTMPIAAINSQKGTRLGDVGKTHQN